MFADGSILIPYISALFKLSPLDCKMFAITFSYPFEISATSPKRILFSPSLKSTISSNSSIEVNLADVLTRYVRLSISTVPAAVSIFSFSIAVATASMVNPCAASLWGNNFMCNSSFVPPGTKILATPFTLSNFSFTSLSRYVKYVSISLSLPFVATKPIQMVGDAFEPADWIIGFCTF